MSHPHTTNLPPAWTPEAVSEALCEIWRGLFNDPLLQPRDTDDFFMLGGSSLLALTLVEKIRNQFQIDVPMKALLNDATFAGLAGLIGEKTAVRPHEDPRAQEALERGSI
jgi:acyl carrier protein